MKPDDRHQVSEGKAHTEGSIAKPVRVMIASRNAALVSALTAAVRRLGHEPVAAAAPHGAVHALSLTERPDIALVDLASSLPVGAGAAVTGSYPKRQDIPVVFVAPPDDERLPELARGPMTYGYLVTPVSDRDLAIALTFALNRSGADRAVRQSEGELRKCRVHLEAMLARRVAEQKKAGVRVNRLLHYIELTERKLATDSLELELHDGSGIPVDGEEAVITADQDLNIVLVNPPAVQMLGWSGDEASGRAVGEIFAVADPAAATRLTGAMHAMAQTGSPGVSEDTIQVTSKTGTVLAFSLWFEPIFDSDQEIAGIVLSFRNAEENRKKEFEAIRSRQLESLNIKVRGVAHDFNNILSSVLANIQLARMAIPDLAPGHDRLNSAEDGVLRARELSLQMLSYANGGALHAKTPDIAGLVRDAGTFVARGSSSRFAFSLPADLWEVIPDEEVIRLILNDLFLFLDGSQPEGGVIDITAENTGPGTSSVDQKAADYVRISLQAPGLVIPVDALPDLFRPGSSLAFALDLSLAESLAKKSGGILDVKSGTAAGTGVMLYLPAIRGPGLAKPQEEARAPAARKNSGAGRILLMDDEGAILEATSEMLRFLGFEVETVSDGEAAVASYLKGRKEGVPFDAVILDITVPGGLGAQETLPKLVALDPGVRAIISSGYSTSPLITDYRSFGFIAAIVKPYGFLELQEALHQVFP